MDGPGRLPGGLAGANGPGPHLVGAGGQEADEAQLSEGRLGHHLGRRTRKT